MKVGDLVRRTYGEGQRPAGTVVGWDPIGRRAKSALYRRHTHALIQWTSGRTYTLSVDYLEVISEGR